MKQYGIFHPFVLSFFSRSLYRDIGKDWKGAGLLYLLLLVSITTVVVTVKFHAGLSVIPSETEPVISQIPDITVQKGVISIEQEQPYVITDPAQGNEPIIIIDTTGEITSLEETNASVLVTKDTIIARDRIYDLAGLAEIEKFVVTKEGITQVIALFSQWFALVSFPFIFIFLYIFRLINVLIFSLIGMIFTKILNVELVFEKLMLLSAVAITPVILAGMILSFVNIRIPFWGRLIISLSYLFFAVRVNSQPDTEQ